MVHFLSTPIIAKYKSFIRESSVENGSLFLVDFLMTN